MSAEVKPDISLEPRHINPVRFDRASPEVEFDFKAHTVKFKDSIRVGETTLPRLLAFGSYTHPSRPEFGTFSNGFGPALGWEIRLSLVSFNDGECTLCIYHDDFQQALYAIQPE